MRKRVFKVYSIPYHKAARKYARIRNRHLWGCKSFSEIIEEEALEIIKNAQKNDMIGELVFCINITSEILNIKFKTFTKYFETVGVDSTKKQLSYPINDYDSRKSYKYTETDMKKLLFSKNRYNLLVEDVGE